MSDVTIFHNPMCGTSRGALALITEAGIEPTVIEYLKAGWTKPQLQDLLARMGARPRDILRTKSPEPPAHLLDSATPDDVVLDAMVADPILVQRPIVITPKGVALCRPSDRVLSLL